METGAGGGRKDVKGILRGYLTRTLRAVLFANVGRMLRSSSLRSARCTRAQTLENRRGQAAASSAKAMRIATLRVALIAVRE